MTLVDHLKKPEVGFVLSRSRRFLFMRVHKVGGTSINAALAAEVGGLLKSKSKKSKQIEWLNNVSDQTIRDNYFLFSVVRNPWDRVVSTYAYMMKQGFIDGISFAKFLEMMSDGSIHNLNERVASHLYRQLDSFSLDGQIFVDYIARFERLEKDWTEISGRIGLKNRTLPVLNTSSHDHYRSMYKTKRMRDIVSRVYGEEISMLGYKF